MQKMEKMEGKRFSIKGKFVHITNKTVLLILCDINMYFIQYFRSKYCSEE